MYLLLPVDETGCMVDDGPSSLQLPWTMLPPPSSPSTNPGGQYPPVSVVHRKLWRAIAALVNVTTFSGLAMMGLLKILHLYMQ